MTKAINTEKYASYKEVENVINLLTTQQKTLLDFLIDKHGDQKRKYTKEPYMVHCLRIVNILNTYLDSMCAASFPWIEIALCHDVLEDTDCTIPELTQFLYAIGYYDLTMMNIVSTVIELTNVYTSDNFPTVNRSSRNIQELVRLRSISAPAATVKYADIKDNIRNIIFLDSNFAKIYLPEKLEILRNQRKGNLMLLAVTYNEVQSEINKLNYMLNSVK